MNREKVIRQITRFDEFIFRFFLFVRALTCIRREPTSTSTSKSRRNGKKAVEKARPCCECYKIIMEGIVECARTCTILWPASLGSTDVKERERGHVCVSVCAHLSSIFMVRSAYF